MIYEGNKKKKRKKKLSELHTDKIAKLEKYTSEKFATQLSFFFFFLLRNMRAEDNDDKKKNESPSILSVSYQLYGKPADSGLQCGGL